MERRKRCVHLWWLGGLERGEMLLGLAEEAGLDEEKNRWEHNAVA